MKHRLEIEAESLFGKEHYNEELHKQLTSGPPTDPWPTLCRPRTPEEQAMIDAHPKPKLTWWQKLFHLKWAICSVAILAILCLKQPDKVEAITIVTDVNGNVITTYPYPYDQTVVVPVPVGDYNLAAARTGSYIYQWLMSTPVPRCPATPTPRPYVPPVYPRPIPTGYSAPAT